MIDSPTSCMGTGVQDSKQSKENLSTDMDGYTIFRETLVDSFM